MADNTLSAFHAMSQKSRIIKIFRAGEKSTKDLVSLKNASETLILPMSSFQIAPVVTGESAHKTHENRNFEKCVLYNGGMKERASCSVQALATALQIPEEQAHEILAEHGRKKSCRVNRRTLRNAYKSVGLRRTSLKRARTVARFIKEHPEGRWICRMRGHVFVIADGVVHPCGMMPSAGSRITDYWRHAA